MNTRADFFRVLFNEGECTSAGNRFATAVKPIEAISHGSYPYFVLNPMQPGTTRADASVIRHANILVEFDYLPLEEQRLTVDKLKMPWSTCVYSGGKSYHFIIALEDACSNKADYDSLVRRIYKALGKAADPTCKNCSRLTRFPGFTRPETFKEQKLIEVRARVPRAEIDSWLLSLGIAAEEPRKPKARPAHRFKRILNAKTQRLLKEGARHMTSDERRKAIFAACYDMFDCNYSAEEVALLLSVAPLGTSLTDEELKSRIQWTWSTWESKHEPQPDAKQEPLTSEIQANSEASA